MVDITYRITGRRPSRRGATSAKLAQKKLEHGNGRFSGLIAAMREGRSLDHVTSVSAEDLGSEETECATQSPYAAILSCSDARVPPEMVLQQGFNDLFVVRVAGNVLGSECLGSLIYAVSHFPKSLKVLAVLGHANCGAVTAAVDVYLSPRKYLGVAGNYPLRTILDQILVSVRTADLGLRQLGAFSTLSEPEYRHALIALSVSVNAAWNAFSLREELIGHAPRGMKVVFAVYDLGSHRLGLFPSNDALPERTGFFEPPSDADEFRNLVTELCGAVKLPRKAHV
jgi:carbonic anhydrase